MYGPGTNVGVEGAVISAAQIIVVLFVVVGRMRIVMAMASSSAMVTTYSGATQKSVRITESEDEGFPCPVAQPTR